MTRDHQGSSVTVKDDPRITKIGKIFRDFKIDEIPQIWNVLVGEMSLVGPRPDVPGYADWLKGEERIILDLRPGVTGPATLKYRNEEALLVEQENPVQYNDDVIFPDKVRINMEYAKNLSFIGDIWILWKTIIG